MNKQFFISIITLLFAHVTFPLVAQTSNSMRILVVGGGGARGAWGGGFAQFLTQQNGGYKRVYGTSTGSLLAPLILLQEFDKLKIAYTSVNQGNIFNKNPFKKKGKNAGDLRGLYAGWRFLLGRESFGESKNLRKLMDQFLDNNEYKKIQTKGLVYTVAVANFKSGKVGYASSETIKNADDMKDWMWASANEPLFMNYVKINDTPFADGGVMQNIPLIEAVRYAQDPSHKVSEIDVIINKPENALAGTSFNNYKLLKGLMCLVELWSVEIRNDNIQIGQLMAISHEYAARKNKMASNSNASNEIKINLYYYPEEMFVGANKIYQKELLFDRDRMKQLWEMGVKGERDHKSSPIQQLILPKSGDENIELNKIMNQNHISEFTIDPNKASMDKTRNKLHKNK